MSLKFTSSLKISLTEKFKGLGEKKFIARVERLVYGARGLNNVAERWLEETKKILSRPAASRGYYKSGSSRLLPNTTSNPMKVTGQLLEALYTRATYTYSNLVAVIKVTAKFRPVYNKSKSHDYSEVLNESHSTIAGYKERAYGKLHEAIAIKLASRGYQ